MLSPIKLEREMRLGTDLRRGRREAWIRPLGVAGKLKRQIENEGNGRGGDGMRFLRLGPRAERARFAFKRKG